MMKVEKNKLYLAAGVLLAVLIWELGIVPVNRKLKSLDKRIVKKEESLREIKRLRKEYSRFKGGAGWGSAGSKKDFTPLAFLEKLSRRIGITCELTYREPRKLDDERMETSVAVELNGVDMGQLLNYLYELENSQELLHIRNLHLVPEKNGLLKVSFDCMGISILSP